jgi:pimeloyl-ACP methyl ester carboxylesterase
MVFGSTFIDLHIGVSQWRERWTSGRRKGVWDSNLVRETLTLRDGRKLSYFIDGLQQQNPKKVPHIICLHAMFLSGNSFLMKEAPSDCVLVCVNRPGYFGTDAPPPHYSFRDFALDIEQLADHLNLDEFYVVGHSSGGPAALACAAHLSSRVRSVGLLSADPEYAHASAPDKKWISRVCIGSCLPAMLEYVFCCLPLARHSSKGLRNDYRLDTSPYTFDVEQDIRQPVLIFAGQEDQILPVEVSRHVQTRLLLSHKRTVHLEVIPKVGHLGLLRDEVLKEFFETLLSLKDGDIETGIGRAQTSFEDNVAEATSDSPVHKRAVLNII